MNDYVKKVKPYVKAVVNLIAFTVTIILCIFVVPRVIVFFMPFVVGWMIAAIANPLVRFFEKKLKIRRKAGSAVVIVAVLALVVLAGYAIGAELIKQTAAFFTEIPQMWESAQHDFQVMGNKLSILYHYLPKDITGMLEELQGNLMEYLGELVSKIGTPTFEAIGRFAKNIPSIVIGVIMGLLSAYFFVAERDYLTNMIPRIVPRFFMRRWQLIKNGFTRAVGGYFKAQLKIELWIYVLLVIGFLILDVRYALLIAIGIAVLDFLPFFGTGLILLPWALIKLLNSDYRMFIGLLIVWGVGQLVRQIIQPKIVGDSIGMPSIPTLFLLFIGYRLAGFLGMIIAVPIGIVVKNMYEEGAFETTRKSIQILFCGFNNFRRLGSEDMAGVSRYEAAQDESSAANKKKE